MCRCLSDWLHCGATAVNNSVRATCCSPWTMTAGRPLRSSGRGTDSHVDPLMAAADYAAERTGLSTRWLHLPAAAAATTAATAATAAAAAAENS